MKGKIFEPVEVIKPFLGIKKGTVLKFDSASSKYISRSAEEEVGDNDYYYSGHAVALDPTIVKSNLGKHFKVFEVADKVAPVEEELKVVKTALPVSFSKTEAKPVVEVKQEPVVDPEEIKNVEVEIEKPVEEEVKGADLMLECGLCHYSNKVAHVKYGIFLPASEGVKLTVTCQNCGLVTNMFYNVGEDDIKEESK